MSAASALAAAQKPSMQHASPADPDFSKPLAWLRSPAAVMAAGAILGLIFYVVIYGVARLDPANIGWLMQGDAATHYLGWAFFRHEPWSFPLGALHRYGLEIAASIVYSDSIPILALLFKPFSSWLPEPFQYTGLWILLCCLLQGALAALLLRRFSDNLPFVLLGTGFFLLSPIMVIRSGGQFAGHFSLLGQWLILAALLLYFSDRLRAAGWFWGLLIALAALTHAYLAVMVAAIGVASLSRGLLQDTAFGIVALLRALIPMLLLPLVAMWLAGYFVIGGYSGGGAGFYSMNLLAPFLPTVTLQSAFLPSHPVATAGQYEGFNYLGLGVLLLLALALATTLRQWREVARSYRFWLPLVGVCVLLTLYALSPRITLGTQTLLELPYPASVVEVFRATGRMFWPVHYALILFALIGAQRIANQRLLIAIVAAALLLQWQDLRLIVYHRSTMKDAAAVYQSPFQGAFWSRAAAPYDRVLLVPPTFSVHDFVPFADYAARHQLGINIAYYGRPPSAAAQAQRDQAVRDFLAGIVDPDALYIITQPALLPTIQARLAPGDRLEHHDGYWVLLPGAAALELAPESPRLPRAQP
ncbi:MULTISPECIES: DUF6311 domain-containing protein [Thiorhodovibrio]|uniref:DUF6311 domain-containing protein n=1 Tax=Thiorhodovibrio TaxID=61593 RepID=UPI00191437EE|nr:MULTISPECIES: DUF6311 domain-containing protein [Thiorhodovibrio]MBK5969022.1 hypothetical protein [Thiorhodovibrio winogradskyi]WPL15097.1 hypothetical protein Thiosp_04961 [Thiorhodovibrio litoralis]